MKALSFSLLLSGVCVGCATHLTSQAVSQEQGIQHLAVDQIQDCTGDAGPCNAGQIRALAVTTYCSAGNVLVKAGKTSIDGGIICPAVP